MTKPFTADITSIDHNINLHIKMVRGSEFYLYV